jgi:hypothetical protein
MSFLLGQMGSLATIPGVQRSVTVSSERSSREDVTLGGTRVVQVAPRAPRSWSITLSPWTTPATVALLEAAAQGLLGEVWLLDVAAARANMLPPEGTAGTSGTAIVVPGFGAMFPVPYSTVITLPVLPSTNYRFSAFSSIATTLTFATIRTYTAAGGLVATSSWQSVAGTGVREHPKVVTTGSTVAYLTITMAVSTYPATALRVAQATTGSTFADAGGFLPGRGTPCRVRVDDPQQVLQQVVAGHGRSDFTIELREVGASGVVVP